MHSQFPCLEFDGNRLSNGPRKTRVLIESADGEHSWGTVGVSDNLIEASWEALVDSVEYKMFLEEERAKGTS